MMKREKLPIRADNTLFVVWVGSNDLMLFDGKAKEVADKIKSSIIKITETIQSQSKHRPVELNPQFKFMVPNWLTYEETI